MKSKTTGVLTAHLTAQGFLFRGYSDRDLSNFIDPFQKLIKLMPVVNVPVKIVFRTRKINLDKDVDTGKGITMYEGKLVGGFDEENSRIAPPEYCDIQRLNRMGEQVFYIAEERETAIAEQKVTTDEFLSVAEFDVISSPHVLDFSAYTHDEQHSVITDEMEKQFQEETFFSARQLYFELQRFLTILESSEDYYNVSNKICDLIKADGRIDGIRYRSYFNGHNLGIWRYRPEDYVFKGSQIERGGLNNDQYAGMGLCSRDDKG